MRTAVFVHDHVFLRGPDGTVFSEGKITDEVFQRYLAIADRIDVFSRMRDVAETGDLVPIRDPRVAFHPCASLSLPRVFTRHLPATLAQLVRLARRADCAILRLPSFLGMLAAPVLRTRRVPIVCEVVGAPREAVSEAFPGPAGRVIAAALDQSCRRTARTTVGAIYVARYLSRELPTQGLSAFASNVQLVAEPDVPPEARYARRSAAVKIGLIGSFRNRYKGIDLAIAACAGLAARGVPCHLHVLGSGDRAPLEAKAASMGFGDRLHFDGIRHSGAPVNAWLNDLDIYVQPSRSEGLPRALVEAMAQGLPCVGSAAGGIPELLSTDFVFPKEDVARFIAILARLATDRDLRTRSGRANAQTARSYSPQELDARRRAFWQEVGQRIEGLRG